MVQNSHLFIHSKYIVYCYLKDPSNKNVTILFLLFYLSMWRKFTRIIKKGLQVDKNKIKQGKIEVDSTSLYWCHHH